MPTNLSASAEPRVRRRFHGPNPKVGKAHQSHVARVTRRRRARFGYPFFASRRSVASRTVPGPIVGLGSGKYILGIIIPIINKSPIWGVQTEFKIDPMDNPGRSRTTRHRPDSRASMDIRGCPVSG
jgi:hypothetical protein